MENSNSLSQYLTSTLFLGVPTAQAHVRGNSEYPDLHGTVLFYQLRDAVLVSAFVEGLPTPENPAPAKTPSTPANPCPASFFGFHLHAGKSCTGTTADPFADADGHFNPGDCPHPSHAGDFPPLLGTNGFAWNSFLTDRFRVRDVLGRTVIIHAHPDDFTTQPSGNSGPMIACGIIEL